MSHWHWKPGFTANAVWFVTALLQWNKAHWDVKPPYKHFVNPPVQFSINSQWTNSRFCLLMTEIRTLFLWFLAFLEVFINKSLHIKFWKFSIITVNKWVNHWDHWQPLTAYPLHSTLCATRLDFVVVFWIALQHKTGNKRCPSGTNEAKAFSVSCSGRWWNEGKPGGKIPFNMFILFIKAKRKTNACKAVPGRGSEDKWQHPLHHRKPHQH